MSEFSIAAALDAWDEIQREQREAERSEVLPWDALGDYAATLSSTNHPPQECGDPYGCPACGEMFRSYHGEEARDE